VHNLENVFREHGPRLHRLALRYLRQPEAAEDAMQEAFARALQKIDQFREEADVTTWLYRITVNVCLDSIRRESTRRTEPIESAAAVRGCPMRIRAAEQRWMLESVTRALDALDPQQRMVVVLRDFEGLSYDQIATITGLPIGTISSRLNRARQQLAKNTR
jgi:RNA polymerase sigma-70 factor (ECF subfamily)